MGFLLLWKRNLCQLTNPFPKPFPLSQTKHMTSSEKQVGKFWPYWSQQALKSVPKQSQKLAKHLSDEFMSSAHKQQNLVYYISKFPDANMLGKGRRLQDQVVMQENYSFKAPRARRAYCQKEKCNL